MLILTCMIMMRSAFDFYSSDTSWLLLIGNWRSLASSRSIRRCKNLERCFIWKSISKDLANNVTRLLFSFQGQTINVTDFCPFLTSLDNLKDLKVFNQTFNKKVWRLSIKQDHQRWRYHRRLWIIKVHRITGIRNTWNHQIPLDHLSPCFHLKWPLDHQTMKDNVNLIILLDHNHQTWIKPILSINYTTRRKKNWTLTDLEPPTYLQMGLKTATNGFPMAPSTP